MKTRVIFVIDGSGSMGSKAEDVRQGFNAYVKELEGKKGITLSAVVFNTKSFPLFRDLPLSKVPKLTHKNYAPGGNTALYDAIGDALDAEKEREEGTQYIVVIMTDGEENSSRRFSKIAIADKIVRRERSDRWTFIYLGADQDSFSEGYKIGISSTNTYGGYGALDPLGGMQDLAGATFAAHSTANMTGSMHSFAQHLASTSTAKMSRKSHGSSSSVTSWPTAVSRSSGLSSTYDPTKGVK